MTQNTKTKSEIIAELVLVLAAAHVPHALLTQASDQGVAAWAFDLAEAIFKEGRKRGYYTQDNRDLPNWDKVRRFG